jgi:hypothetical protein
MVLLLNRFPQAYAGEKHYEAEFHSLSAGLYDDVNNIAIFMPGLIIVLF